MTPTCAEIEALTLFLAERAELWKIHARGCGVADPDRVAQWLAEEYRNEVSATCKPKPRARQMKP